MLPMLSGGRSNPVSPLAHHDPLTGLPNRTLLQERMCRTLARCQHGAHLAAILFIALDRFRTINDCMGHGGGDRALREVARRLRRCVQGGDTVARVGGDQFIILLDGIEHPQAVLRIADRVQDALAQAIQLDGLRFGLTASIGISLIPDDGRSVADLLRSADSAMYYSKSRGGDACHFIVEFQPRHG